MSRRFNPSLHPRDARGRWAEKAAGRLPSGNTPLTPEPKGWAAKVNEQIAPPKVSGGPNWGEDFARRMKDEHPGVNLAISGGGNKPVIVHSIVVPKSERGGGTGSKIMRELLEIADRNGDTVALTPSGDFGGSVTKLKRWYASLGFVLNKGRARDFEISEDMYRLPR